MTVVNIHEAKTHLSRLVEAAEAGEVVTIARAGRPVAKIVRIDAPTAPRRLGFLASQASIPDDFDRFAVDVITEDFEGSEAIT